MRDLLKNEGNETQMQLGGNSKMPQPIFALELVPMEWAGESERERGGISPESQLR